MILVNRQVSILSKRCLNQLLKNWTILWQQFENTSKEEKTAEKKEKTNEGFDYAPEVDPYEDMDAAEG